jgi:DNA-directed RNA polymerase specialized sigma24 family protein
MPPAQSVVETDAASGSTQTTNGRFDPDRGVPFKSWFSRLLYYKALTMLAKKKRRMDLDHLLRWADECQSDADLHVFVEELLAGLSEHEETIARRHATGETFSAIGLDMNLSTSSVHKTYRSAVAKMRAVASIARSEH